MLSRISLLTLVALAAQPANAKTSRQDVQWVVSKMRSRTARNLLTSKRGGTGDQIVFLDGRHRYTFYRSDLSGKQFLSIRVGKLSCSDVGLDGRVDFGIKGKPGDPDSTRQHFQSKEEPPIKPTGAQYRAVWQAVFDKAIAAARRRL